MNFTSCRECQRSVSLEAVTCPHCGVPAPAGEERRCAYCHCELVPGMERCPRCGGPAMPLPGRTARSRRRWPMVASGGFALALGFVIAMMTTRSGSPPDEPARVTKSAPSIGIDCSLSDPVVGALTHEDALNATAISARGDRKGLDRLVKRGRVQLVRGGPRARIADTGPGTLKVVVLGGPSRGSVLWVPEERCR